MKTYFILAVIAPIMFSIGWTVRFIFYYDIKDAKEFLNWNKSNYEDKFDIWYIIFYVILFWPLNLLDTYIAMQERVDLFYQSKRESK